MDFTKKTWQDRQSQYPNRRRLETTNADGIYEVERAEGEILEPGHQFNAENMNDLENRVYKGFTTLNGADVAIKDVENHFTSTKLDGVLNELFTYADNGRKGIVSAIGATRNGAPATNETFASLANRVAKDKTSFRIVSLDGKNATTKSSASASLTIPVTIGFRADKVFIDNVILEVDIEKSSAMEYLRLVYWVGLNNKHEVYCKADNWGAIATTANLTTTVTNGVTTAITISVTVRNGTNSNSIFYGLPIKEIRIKNSQNNLYAFGGET